MNNNMVNNPETEVPKTPEMNDSDYLNDFLATEKSLSSNYVMVMNEASNNSLFDEIGNICQETKDMARNLFNLQFKKGWYKLEKAQDSKINTVIQEYEPKSNELE
ncbi:MAG: spore coat protein [Bacilli bacterium]|nr:spore coat protein [Bacilli bacterium]MDD4643849.1 spore coat protein [Bacilli bacterium]